MPSSALACGPARHLAFPASQVVILLPHLSQQLYTSLVFQTSGSIRLLQGLQQMPSVRPDLLRQDRALAFCLVHAIVLDPVAVPLTPARADLLDQPIRGQDRYIIE